jgi:uncharacterized delta-60 repeat protein
MDGDLDPSFGSGGKVTTHFAQGSSSASALVVQADSAILVVGSAGGDFLVARYLSNGSLDPSFGSRGLVTTDFGWDDSAKALAVQPDGKIVVAGSTYSSTAQTASIALARYLPNGHLDSTFGTGGLVATNLGLSNYLYGNGVALQSDGKIVVAGNDLRGECVHFCNNYFMVARYNPKGSLDISFGGTGLIFTDFPHAALFNFATSVIIQPDSKIVAAGSSATAPSSGNAGDFALARYLPDGSLDPSFGISGTVSTDFARSVDSAQALLLQSDGKLVAVGRADYWYCPPNDYCEEHWHYGIARYRSNGQLDASFGVSGTTAVTFAAFDQANSVTLQRDGKLVVAGLQSTTPYGNQGLALARLLPTGAEDSSFGNSGKVVTTFGNASAANGVALQPDGKIVAAGMGQGTSGTMDVALARYLSSLR